MNKFKLKSKYEATLDQKNAIEKLSKNYLDGKKYQVLLGVTGSGKTFTIANLIHILQLPTLVISHNKTLAAQLYQEFRDYFPQNSVSYFVSYYDYYQPEAYIPSTDTYIEKDAGINELIDKLRLQSTTNLSTRNDVIVVASVSCIYNLGSPKEYGKFVFDFKKGNKISRKDFIDKLVNIYYERSDFGFHRGTFRVRGDIIDIYPSYQDDAIRVELGIDKIDNISIVNPISGKTVRKSLNNYVLYPSKHFVTDPRKNKPTLEQIRHDLEKRVKELKSNKKDIEAHRLSQRVKYDLEMIKEVGYVKGIENYSRYFDNRKPGDPPYTLLDYFNEPRKENWLVVVDESHITFPQIRGMYRGDLSRKKTLINYGFRLPSALDNRPLKFDEFMRRIPNFIATSATPSKWELSMAATSNKPKNNNCVVQQLLRPTGITDPKVDIRPVSNQVEDVIYEIKKRSQKKQRSLVTTLTKRTAEDLSQFLSEKGISVQYLHSDIKTLERTDILDKLRKGNYDCIVGVNLLREGLDLPEVTLVAILDADKEGFLRSEVSLIQTMGRAARHVEGQVILYADKNTNSMKRALSEVDRRRKYQIKMNKKYKIKPKSIKKPIREKIIEQETKKELGFFFPNSDIYQTLSDLDLDGYTPMDKKRLVRKLRREMRILSQDLNFELAAKIRDKIIDIEGRI
jgi:excinuclease ABC subunit B